MVSNGLTTARLKSDTQPIIRDWLIIFNIDFFEESYRDGVYSKRHIDGL